MASVVPTMHGERLRRLRALTEVSRSLTHATLDQVLELAVERAAELVSAERTLLMLADDEGLLRVQASRGIDPEKVERAHGPLSETLAHRLQELLDDPRQESFVSVPLVVNGAVIGVLAAVRNDDSTGSEDDEWLLSALADQVAVAIENARLAGAVRDERAKARQASETYGRTRATLGHELRSPLMAIEGYCSLLLDGLHGPLTDRQRESVSRIRLGGRHLLSVIENVVEASRIDAGAVHLSLEDVPLHDVVEEALHMVRPSMARKEQRLTVDVPRELVVRADRSRLRQALVNVLDNARKYTPRGGRVEVRGEILQREDGPWAAASVGDDGRGISEDALRTIFEPYERGDGLSHEGGLGLGLYISRHLVRRMHGDIEVETERGAGSTFRVLLPLRDD